MKILELTQGSAEWHAHRAKHFNASDAPAMMGVSSYKTRQQLLKEIATGVSEDAGAATQKRFDDGHRFEALARPIAEKRIGEELFPCVGVDGKYSASFDGITMDGAVIFEHKTLNNRLRFLTDNHTGADLPEEYRVQLEHQLMVSGASSALFMATVWLEDDTIGESRLVMYRQDLALRERIIAAWAQFEADLAAYQAPAATAQVVGRTPDNLPALRIEVTGAVTASNLVEFKAHALAVFDGINRDLQTDQDFADAKKAVKWCSDVEARLDAAKQHALSQTASIDELFRTVDDVKAAARAVRLELDKLVKVREEAIKADIVRVGMTAMNEHIAALNVRIGHDLMPAAEFTSARFANAIKGKRTIESMQNAVSDALAQAKIDANAIADKITINLRMIEAQEMRALFPDLQALVLKQHDDLQAVIDSRVARHKTEEANRVENANQEEKPIVSRAPSITAVTVAPRKPAEKPSDEAIFDAVATHFGVERSIAIEWLLDFVAECLARRICNF